MKGLADIVTDLTQAKWSAIDQAYAGRVDAVGPDRRWLLVQTLATAGARRVLIGSLPIQPGWRIADVGCGFGASTLELAALGAASAVGVDLDDPVLGVAAAVAAAMPGTSASFTRGNAYDLPFRSQSLDAVFSRFVFQHLADPAAAAAELGRVLAPGGLACVVDVDDGLSISEPPPSDAYRRLAEALTASQGAAGGDRMVGRRLAGLLDRHGLTPRNVLVLPQAAYRAPQPGDPERSLLLERLRAARAGIVGRGAMTPEAFDADLDAVAQERPGPVCEIEAHLAVIATRR